MRISPNWALAGALSLLAACGGSSTATTDVGVGAVLIKDATYDQLGTFVVTFSQGTLIGTGGTENHVLFSDAVQLDLLQLAINSSVLSGGDIPVGSYSGIELVVSALSATDSSAASLTFDGASSLPVTVPMEFATPLVVAAGAPIDILLDFDVRRSYTETGALSFDMSPVVKPDPDPPTMELSQLLVRVLSKNVEAKTVTVRTTTQPYRIMVMQINEKVPFVADYQNVYVGSANVMSAIEVGTDITIDEARYSQGKVRPFILIKGADSYPAEFAIAYGVVTSVNSTTNEILVQLQGCDRDNTTGSVMTAKAGSNDTIKLVYQDSQTNLLLSKYGNTVTTPGDNAVVGMELGFGGTWNDTTSEFTPILAMLGGHGLYAKIKTVPTNVSGTIWSMPLKEVYKNGSPVSDTTVYFDSSLGKMFRAGQPITDLSTVKVDDQIQLEFGYNLDRGRDEIAKAAVAGKRCGFPVDSLTVSSIVATGDPITFDAEIDSSSGDEQWTKQQLKGSSGAADFTLHVSVPLDAMMFSYHEATKKGKDVPYSTLATQLSQLQSTDKIYLDGWFDNATDTFHVSEIFLQLGSN